MKKEERMKMSEEEKMEEFDGRRLPDDEEAGYDAETFRREAEELAERYPEACGKPLPDEVIRAVMDGKSLLEAYEDYLNARSHESDAGKRDKAAAKRAPVRGVSGGAAVRERGEDDFLRGFHADEEYN